jgi:hypothetical protein
MLVVESITRIPGFKKHDPFMEVPERESVHLRQEDGPSFPGSNQEDIVSMVVMAPAGSFRVGDTMDDLILYDLLTDFEDVD